VSKTRCFQTGNKSTKGGEGVNELERILQYFADLFVSVASNG
jgi:hypothetical protein